MSKVLLQALFELSDSNLESTSRDVQQKIRAALE